MTRGSSGEWETAYDKPHTPSGWLILAEAIDSQLYLEKQNHGGKTTIIHQA